MCRGGSGGGLYGHGDIDFRILHLAEMEAAFTAVRRGSLHVSNSVANVEWRATPPRSPRRPYRGLVGTRLSQPIMVDVSSISIASGAPARLGEHGCRVVVVTDRARTHQHDALWTPVLMHC